MSRVSTSPVVSAFRRIASAFPVVSAFRRTVLTLGMVTAAHSASAQIDGHASVMVDVLPDLGEQGGAQTVTEFRTRVFVERRGSWGDHVRFNASAYVDGLLANRGATGNSSDRDAILRPGDLYLEVARDRFDVRAGMSRMVWGRLDEFQPTDVVNPLDLTRFLLEGRAEARLPVAMVRSRVFLPHGSTIEGIVVPAFRGSTFDQLVEDTSPFNLTRRSGVDVHRDSPAFGAGSLQGGARFTSTTGRVDWAMTAYRGFRTFPTLTLVPTFAPPPLVIETFPRFTMIGGDFETTRGAWGIRGELAAFVDDELQSTLLARGVPGRSIDAGAGVDRKAGSYRIAGDVLWSTRRVTDAISDRGAELARSELNRTDLNLVLAVDRTFARETRNVRVFAVYDPADDTTFSRIIAGISLHDNVWLEGSGGLFSGDADDTLGRLASRDFLYARLKVYF